MPIDVFTPLTLGLGGSAGPSSNSRFLPRIPPRAAVSVRCDAALLGTADRGAALVGVVVRVDAVGGGIDTAGT
jgi:hypothetical protein